MNLPQHPDATGPDGEHNSQQPANGTRSRATTVVLWAIAAIVVFVIVLHLTGVVGPLSK